MQRSDQILCQLLEHSAVQSVLVLGNNAASIAHKLRDSTAAQITAEYWQHIELRPGRAATGNDHPGFPLRNLAQFDLVYLADLPTGLAADLASDLAASPVSAKLAQCLSQLKSHCQGELLLEFDRRNGLATDNQFSALGFSRALLSAESEGRFAVYRYSLHSYKSAPDWLNSRHWANPERWSLD